MFRRILLAMVALILASGAACDLPPDLNCPPGAGPRLVVRADSLGGMAESTVKPWLVEDHAQGPVCYKAEGGTQINNHQASLPLVTADDCAVIALGTNDISNEVHQQTQLDMQAAANELVDARAQIWFTINPESGRLRGTPFSSRTRWFNEELLRMADDPRWPNLIVWRWDLQAVGHPEWLMPDEIHLNTEGTERYAESMRAAADVCWPDVPVPSTTTSSTTTTTQSAAARATALTAA